MKKILILYIPLFLCGIPISVGAQSSTEAFISEQLLPENTLAVCVFTNLQEMVEKFKQTLLFEILYPEPYSASSTSSTTAPSTSLRTGPSTEFIPSEGEGLRTGVTPPTEKMQQEFSIFAEEFRQNAGFRLSDVRTIFHKSIAIALVDVSPGEIMGTNMPYPKFALIADVSDSADALKNLLETAIVPGLQTKEPTIEFFVESFEGINIYGLANNRFQIHYTFLENAFVLALEQETIRKIISVSEPVLSSAEGNLFNAPLYRSVVKDMSKDGHEVRIYVDIQNIWLKLRPYIRQACSNKPSIENTIILDMLDKYPLQSLFWTFSYKDRGGYERMFLRIKNPRINQVPSGRNETFTSDRIVPADVLYYGASRVNLPEIWQQFSALINSSPYPQQIEHFNNWVKRMEDTFHLNIEKEFLTAFGREIAFACHTGEFRRRFVREKPSLEDFPFLVMFQVKNKEILEYTFQNISAILHTKPRKEVYQNTEIQSLAIPGKIAPFIVYTAFVKDFLVVSVSRTMLQELITASQHKRSLAAAKDYRKLSLYFPSRGYSKGYINITKLSGLVRRFLNRDNRLEPSSQDDKSLSVLDLTVFAEQLPGMMWVTTVAADGFLTESFSPIGGTVAGIAMAWLGLSLL